MDEGLKSLKEFVVPIPSAPPKSPKKPEVPALK